MIKAHVVIEYEEYIWIRKFKHFVDCDYSIYKSMSNMTKR